jgi:5'(3')-deoxyribonucleotidase
MPDPILGFDLDGVVADLMSAILSSCKDRKWISPLITAYQMNEWEITTMLGITEKQLIQVLTADIYRSVGDHEEVVNDLHRWIGMGIPILYVTARSEAWTPGIEDATHDWLNGRGILRGTLGVQYISTTRKHQIVRGFGVDIYVDDHPMAIELVRKQTSAHPMLLARPWNRRASPRHEWDEIRGRIDEEIGLRRAGASGRSCG